MPLHDWTEDAGWEGVHHLWLTELLYWIKPRLPAGYRTYIGSPPTLAVGGLPGKPDIGVHRWSEEKPPEPSAQTDADVAADAQGAEPDLEVALMRLPLDAALFVERGGEVVAAVELISPRNKDRPLARTTYAARYLGYLLRGVHLLLVDVLPRPRGFSFADRIAEELQLPSEPLPPPLAVCYRVGEPAATGGRFLALWRRPLKVGEPLPVLSLPLTVKQSVAVDFEQTYQRAAAGAYLTG
jgi:hypothetical protein